MEKHIAPEFLTLAVGARDKRHLSPAEQLSIPLGGLAGGWLVYEPLLNLFHLRGPGSGDEIAAIGATIAGAAIGLAAATLNTACESGPSYRQKELLSRGAGAGTGIGIGSGLAALDVVTTGGMATLLVLGAGALGAAAGDLGNRLFSQKRCRVCGKRWKCCRRICMRCGNVFDVDKDWCDRSIDDSESTVTDYLTFRDVVSIFDCNGLNYVEACAALEKHAPEWSLGHGPEYVISKRLFLKWLGTNQPLRERYRGLRPSEDFWTLAEAAVRSECDPKRPISLHDISSWP